jgi:hypothetical protein
VPSRHRAGIFGGCSRCRGSRQLIPAGPAKPGARWRFGQHSPADSTEIQRQRGYEALSDLDPDNVSDIYGALENFEKFRAKIEASASKKYDAVGFDADKYPTSSSAPGS